MISNKELNEVKLPSGTISQHLPKEKLSCSVGRKNSYVVFNYEDFVFENIEQKRSKQPVKNYSTGRYNKSKTAHNKNMNNSVKAKLSYKNERSKKIGMQLNSTEYHSPLSYNKKNKSEKTYEVEEKAIDVEVKKGKKRKKCESHSSLELSQENNKSLSQESNSHKLKVKTSINEISNNNLKPKPASENIGDSLSEVINSVACNSELNIQTDDTRSRKISDNFGDSLNEVISSVACNSELNIQTNNTSKKMKSKKIKTLEDRLSKENNSVICNTELMETDDTKSTTMKSKKSKTIKDSSSNNNLKTKVFSNNSDDLTKEVNAFDTLCQGSAVKVKNKKRKNSANLNNEHKGINTVNVQETPLLTNNLLQKHGEPERKKTKTLISESTLSSDLHKTREAEALIKEVNTKSQKQNNEKSQNLKNENNNCVSTNVNYRLKDTKTRTASKLSKKQEQKNNQILKSLTNNSLYIKTIEEKLCNEKTIQDEIQAVGIDNGANRSITELLSSFKPSPKESSKKDNKKKKKQNEQLELIKKSELSKEFVNTNGSSSVIQVPVSPQKDKDKDNKKKNSSIDIAVQVSPEKSHDRENKKKKKNGKLELVKESKLSKEIISTDDSSSDSETSGSSRRDNDKDNKKKSSSRDIAIRVSAERYNDRNKKKKKNKKLELVRESKLSKEFITTDDSASDSKVEEGGKDYETASTSCSDGLHLNETPQQTVKTRVNTPEKSTPACSRKVISKEFISSDDSSDDDEINGSRKNKKKAFRKARDLLKDESDSDVLEDIQRLRSLRIFVPWVVPRVHLIETRMSSVPNPEQIDEFNSLGIRFKKGPYNTAEDEKIKQNWLDFCKDHNLSTNPKLFLGLSWPTKASLHTINKLNFVRYLARDLPNRMLYSIYKRFQTLYTPLKKDKFTEEEDDVILNFYLNSKVKNKRSALGSILNRSRESIKYRHLNLLTDENTLYWTNELTQDLVDHLLEETRQNNIKDLKDIDITLENWKNIEEKMKITVSKLKRRWYATVYPKLFIEEYRFLNEIRRKLIKLLSKKKFPDRRSIIWSDLAKEFNNITGQRLNRIFSCLISTYVPKRKRNDLKAIIEILSTSLNSFCDKKIIKYKYKGAKIIFDEPKVKPENQQPK